MKRVALGLSGGVDSAVTAFLLKQQGYDVHCIYLNCFDEDVPGCRAKQDRKDALAVSMHLKLPFQVLDFRKQYQQSVIEYFKREYEVGRTPNPDVVCNRDIKFGLFYDWSIKEGFDYVATGHYARLSPSLSQPKDLHKDQTYFLWQVPRERFEQVLFPLGDYLKSEVREIAREAKLPVAEKKDSTGICFIGEVNVEEFLKSLGVKEKEGEVVMRIAESGERKAESAADYEVIGRHWGITFYTIGQRHGFEINPKSEIRNPKQSNQNFNDQNSKNLKHSDLENSNLFRASNLDIRVFPQDRPPLYVVEKDVARNRLIVGFGAETYRNQFNVSDVNWLIHNSLRPRSGRAYFANHKSPHVFVRIHHGGELIPCELSVVGRKLSVALATPARGIAPGQSAVFYIKKGTVLGGGVIECEGSDPSHC